MAARRKSVGAAIELRRLNEVTMEVPIVGQTPIIPHKWSEKAIRMMPGHPDGEAVKSKKGQREPEEEAEACTYRLPDGRPGMPSTAFKAAIIAACRFFDKPSMTEAKNLIFVHGEGPDQLVAIDGEVRMRNGGEGEPARNANGGADLRYRNEIINWSATLKISFVASSISASAVATLVDAAGRCGVGDWRPSSPKSATGIYGTWRADVE